MIRRRSFLTGLAAALWAPAIVRAEHLMPIRGIVMDIDPFVSRVWEGITPMRPLSDLFMVLAPTEYEHLVFRGPDGLIPNVRLIKQTLIPTTPDWAV
jgi:hypothetical protein